MQLPHSQSHVFSMFSLLQSSYQQQHRHPPASPSTFHQSWWSSSALVSGGPPRPWRLRVLLGDGQRTSGQFCPQDPVDGGQLGSSRHCQLALLPWSYCQGRPVNQWLFTWISYIYSWICFPVLYLEMWHNAQLPVLLRFSKRFLY